MRLLKKQLLFPIWCSWQISGKDQLHIKAADSGYAPDTALDLKTCLSCINGAVQGHHATIDYHLNIG